MSTRQNNPLKQLGTLGQSIWLDYIRRDLIAGGGLRRMIDEDGIQGVTSNPSIFEKAIAESHIYDHDIRAMALKEKNVEAIYETLSQCDVQNAADEFRSVYEETDGKDGYVSLEVNPHLAHDTKGTIEEARRLWIALNRPNVFIKVPATSDGLPAIQQLISEGINVNVTLLFGLPRYRRVAEAYIAGIEALWWRNSSSQAVRKRKLRRRCADKWLSRVLRRLIKSTRRFLEVIDLRSWLLRMLVYSGCSGPALAPRTRTMVM
jgi:transaldolase